MLNKKRLRKGRYKECGNKPGYKPLIYESETTMIITMKIVKWSLYVIKKSVIVKNKTDV